MERTSRRAVRPWRKGAMQGRDTERTSMAGSTAVQDSIEEYPEGKGGWLVGLFLI